MYFLLKYLFDVTLCFKSEFHFNMFLK